MEKTFEIQFSDASTAEANQLAQELKAYLVTYENIDGEIKKENDQTQDVGTILQIVLGSAAFIAFIKGLSNWLLKKQSRKITIRKNGDVIGENLSSGDLEKILDKF